MTRQETVQVLTILASNYRSFDEQVKDKGKLKIMTEIWFDCLGDIDYKLCCAAVKKCIITNKFPPTIHEIRKAATEMIQPDTGRTAMDAWHEALKMISCGTYMTQEEYDAHSDDVKRFIGSVNQVRELAKTDADIVNTVTKGQFLKQYEAQKMRDDEMRMLPESMVDHIKTIANRMTIGS